MEGNVPGGWERQRNVSQKGKSGTKKVGVWDTSRYERQRAKRKKKIRTLQKEISESPRLKFKKKRENVITSSKGKKWLADIGTPTLWGVDPCGGVQGHSC